MRTASSELTVSDGRTGLLVRDLAEFRARLGELVADRARREAMGRAASEYVAARHSMAVRARQLESFLETPDTDTSPPLTSLAPRHVIVDGQVPSTARRRDD
jgi:hypothetical protein